MLALIRSNALAAALGGLSVILLATCLYLAVTINGFLWFDGLKDDLEECQRDANELRQLSKKKNEQAETTERNIRESEKRIQTSDKVAREIEAAPLPGNCATPSEILGADL